MRKAVYRIISLLKRGEVSPMCWPCLYKEYSITIWAASREGTANCLDRLRSACHHIMPSAKDHPARKICQGHWHLIGCFWARCKIVEPDCLSYRAWKNRARSDTKFW